MRGPQGFGRCVNIGMNVVLCLGISLYVLIFMQSQHPGAPILTPPALLQAFVSSFVVGYTMGDIIPAFTWGGKLVAALRVKNRLAAHFIVSIVLGVCYATSIFLVVSFINNYLTQGMAGVLGFFISLILQIILLAIILVLVFLLPVQRLAKAVSGFDPVAPSAGGGQKALGGQA
ncbi:MAG TPA: hypothetical protein VN441_15045 [Syntrophomonas sp.]|nr:hypothetical protein [Syntrophomonas sp.]